MATFQPGFQPGFQGVQQPSTAVGGGMVAGRGREIWAQSQAIWLVEQQRRAALGIPDTATLQAAIARHLARRQREDDWLLGLISDQQYLQEAA